MHHLSLGVVEMRSNNQLQRMQKERLEEMMQKKWSFHFGGHSSSECGMKASDPQERECTASVSSRIYHPLGAQVKGRHRRPLPCSAMKWLLLNPRSAVIDSW